MKSKIVINDPSAGIELKEIVETVFNRKKLAFIKEEEIQGSSGEDHPFEMVIKGTPVKICVKILDYKKHCGVDSILKMAKINKDCETVKILVVSNAFSLSAKSMAEKTKITLFSRGELVSMLNMEYPKSVFDV